MANDGMLMNFSVGDAFVNATPTFKGGRWKDRVAAKKVARYRHQKAISSLRPHLQTRRSGIENIIPDEVASPSISRAPMSAKRQRIDEDYSPALNRHAGKSAGHMFTGRHGDQPRGKSTQVVSSLFSNNLVPKVASENGAEAVKPAQPSNAPLVDGLDTFTTLGLTSTLAAFLLTKLDLKAPTAIQKAAITQLVREDTDAFIQAETGSGKTLAYLLPIVQRIMALSEKPVNREHANVDELVHRTSGLFAIVLAPTRELCKQISLVLERLLRCAHWIVAGTVIGGEKRKSEKARLRKGLNILVATPGRLADHLNNTEVLDVSNVRWLVLDEGDRLMELGFEEEILGIVAKLEKRSQVAKIRGTYTQGLPNKRTTILCSATMKMNVQRLGEISLKEAVHIKADASDADALPHDGAPKYLAFSAPAQLKQSYALVPAKLRLVTLTAMLKRAFARRGSVIKVIVFISCADSVDFHFEAFARTFRGNEQIAAESAAEDLKNRNEHGTVAHASAFSGTENPVTLYRLHGSLAQNVRTATLASFTKSENPGVLICTDVASRGLDLPNIDLVIEFDPPFSKDDHLHRVGRTARAGQDGRAVIFLLVGDEEGYVNILKEGYRDGGKGLVRNDVDELLKKGFGSSETQKWKDWEEKATEWQLDVERWVLDNPRYLELARQAFQSHMRAYATHVAAERGIFNMKTLHFGHLAKSFALRDKPGNIKVPGLRPDAGSTRSHHTTERRQTKPLAEGVERRPRRIDRELPRTDGQEAVRKMKIKMKEHLASASEFNIG
ncbi:MAG: ATP-dependent RNA helicase dbp7 [Pycnora praestabilis]|nr:MAG: ATP-dependent RNA helicase dbp7 [Pycnora praestabilis]